MSATALGREEPVENDLTTSPDIDSLRKEIDWLDAEILRLTRKREGCERKGGP